MLVFDSFVVEPSTPLPCQVLHACAAHESGQGGGQREGQDLHHKKDADASVGRSVHDWPGEGAAEALHTHTHVRICALADHVVVQRCNMDEVESLYIKLKDYDLVGGDDDLGEVSFNLST